MFTTVFFALIRNWLIYVIRVNVLHCIVHAFLTQKNIDMVWHVNIVYQFFPNPIVISDLRTTIIVIIIIVTRQLRSFLTLKQRESYN